MKTLIFIAGMATGMMVSFFYLGSVFKPQKD